ncbi:MAG: DUF4157 domain-containing protein, partial [Saprospiraceae bacterium]
MKPKPAARTAFFQPKLTVNTPGDAYEREADRIADQTVRAPVNEVLPAPTYGNLQRTTIGGNASQPPPPIVSEVLSSAGGQPMDDTTRQFMESRMGQDFSQVRVHTDARAAESAQAIQARAYTSGQDVVFGAGEYQPGSESGQRLLAHELVHVGQQGGNKPPNLISRKENVPEVQGNPAVHAPATHPAAVPVPRTDVFYLMGNAKKDGFYKAALRFYKPRFPNAVFKTEIRTLTGLLDDLSQTFTQPLGNIFIVSHANEDGTLSFGVNEGDKDKKTSVTDMRAALHPTGGGASSLPAVGNLIDEHTRI